MWPKRPTLVVRVVISRYRTIHWSAGNRGRPDQHDWKQSKSESVWDISLYWFSYISRSLIESANWLASCMRVRTSKWSDHQHQMKQNRAKPPPLKNNYQMITSPAWVDQWKGIFSKQTAPLIITSHYKILPPSPWYMNLDFRIIEPGKRYRNVGVGWDLVIDGSPDH